MRRFARKYTVWPLIVGGTGVNLLCIVTIGGEGTERSRLLLLNRGDEREGFSVRTHKPIIIKSEAVEALTTLCCNFLCKEVLAEDCWDHNLVFEVIACLIVTVVLLHEHNSHVARLFIEVYVFKSRVAN